MTIENSYTLQMKYPPGSPVIKTDLGKYQAYVIPIEVKPCEHKNVVTTSLDGTLLCVCSDCDKKLIPTWTVQE